MLILINCKHDHIAFEKGSKELVSELDIMKFDKGRMELVL